MGKFSESVLQQNCVKWFDLQYPKSKLSLFAIPNEGARTKANGARLKAQGLRAGVADLMLACCNSKFHGLFIEFKSETGHQRETQKEFEKQAVNNGYKYAICRDFYEFKELIERYLND